MTTLSSEELLTQIKAGLGIAGDYQDATLNVYINDAKAFMISAGVSEAVVNSDRAVGCILRGVVDTWDYGNGSGKYSEMFRMRVIQLAAESEDDNVQTYQGETDDDSL